MAFLCDKCLEVLPENVLHCERCYPNGVVLFEGVTKEAHDKLKSDYAALSEENRRLREALNKIGKETELHVIRDKHNRVVRTEYVPTKTAEIARRAMEG